MQTIETITKNHCYCIFEKELSTFFNFSSNFVERTPVKLKYFHLIDGSITFQIFTCAQFSATQCGIHLHFESKFALLKNGKCLKNSAEETP